MVMIRVKLAKTSACSLAVCRTEWRMGPFFKIQSNPYPTQQTNALLENYNKRTNNRA